MCEIGEKGARERYHWSDVDGQLTGKYTMTGGGGKTPPARTRRSKIQENQRQGREGIVPSDLQWMEPVRCSSDSGDGDSARGGGRSLRALSENHESGRKTRKENVSSARTSNTTKSDLKGNNGRKRMSIT